MQKVQMSGISSSAVAAHVKKTSMQVVVAPVRSSSSAKVHMGGGGIISPCIGKHVTKSAKVSFGGGGVVHPFVVQHTQK